MTRKVLIAAIIIVALVLGLRLVIHPIPENWPATFTRWAFSELEVGVLAFQLDFGVAYVPSRIKLSETGNYPERGRPGTLDHDSVQYLQKAWPRIDLSPGCRLDWNGDGQIQGDWVLEGDECLVFFVGGIPEEVNGPNPRCRGFAGPDRPDPTERGGVRHGPYCDFALSRLRDLHGRGFLSYLDNFGRGRPYAYFSPYGVEDGYNRYGGTDCPTLGVWPYAGALTPRPRYLNPRGFQIVSAGPDGRFGPGTDRESHTWPPATARDMPAEGRDDAANFSDVSLGVGEQ
jgi:hypothetical protein